MFREKVSLEKRQKLKEVLRYEGETITPKHKKPYIQGFLEGQEKEVVENQILIESLHGKDINGHLFALSMKLNNMSDYDVYIVTKNQSKAEEMFKQYDLQNIKIVDHLSYQYGLLLATSEILINDNTFFPFFSKRDGQKYYNLWHGTPLKTLGKHIEGEFLDFGNVARNFMMTDGLYFPNTYSADKLLSSLDLDGVLKTDVYIAPSPRNAMLFDQNRGSQIKALLNLQGKKTYIYMPTWRGNKKDKSIQFNEEEILRQLEAKLPDDAIIFYKLHSMVTKNINFEGTKVLPFPDEYDVYDFMSAVDGLITDYSSIMYDFASQNKRVILYTYDYEEYLSSRGVYEKIDDYPFDITEDISKVVEYIKSDEPVDYSAFIEQYCAKDNIDGAQELLDHMLRQKESDNIEQFDNYNNKPNVYMFVGPMWDTGITAALKNLLKNIDTTEKNYIVCFERKAIKASGEENLKLLPENVKLYPVEGIRILTSEEKKLHKKYESEGNAAAFSDELIAIENREIRRVFGNNIPDYYIHYTGFESKYSEYVVFLKNFGTKTMIYVHTDMFEDYKNKKNYNKNLVSDAWKNADEHVLVNENLKEGFYAHYPQGLDNIAVANNFLGVKRMNELLKEDFLETFLKVRFHFRTFQKSKTNVYDTLNQTFIDPSTTNDTLIHAAIQKFSENPVVKYAKTEKQRKLLLQNKDLKQALQLTYIQTVYGDEVFEDFSHIIEEEDKRIKYLIDFFKDEANASFISRYFDDIQKYIDEYAESVQNVTGVTLPLTSEERFELFKQDFGLRKMEVLKELEDPNIKVFFNIGRFDQQKGHDRLIRAFEKTYAKDKNTRLYILASYGPIKKETLKQVEQSPASSAITVFDRMSNPFLLLNKVDAFVLSSYYEGLGLVVYESMFVNTPVISVNLATTTQFLSESDIILVDNSEAGIVEGMQRLINNELPTTSFDFDKYETDRVKEFESMFLEK